MSDKAVMVHNEALYPSTFDGALRMGGELIKSGFLPESIKTPQQAAAIILTGLEYGWPAMRSFRLINIIKGKPTIASQGMGSMIFAAGHSYNVDALTEEHCTITFQRRGKTRPYTHKFTTDDAKAAGLLGKEMWSKYRKAMLFSRCLSAGARIEMPDVIEGFYTPEELAEEGQLVFDEEGTVVDVIDAEVTEAPERPQAAPQPKATPAKAAPAKGDGGEAKTEKKPAPREALEKRLGELLEKAAALGMDRWANPFHLTGHLQKHYGIKTLADLSNDDLIKLGKQIKAEIVEKEAEQDNLAASAEATGAPDDVMTEHYLSREDNEHAMPAEA